MSSLIKKFMLDKMSLYFNKIRTRLPDDVNVKTFGAILDGSYHPCSEWVGQGKRFSTFGELQAVYPFVQRLDESIDYIAIQAASNYITKTSQKGTLRLSGIAVVNRELIIRSVQTWIGDCKPDIRWDWRQRSDSIIDGTQIRIIDGIQICKSIKTRIGYRGSLQAPHDDPISVGINIQSGGVTLTNTFAVICDFDYKKIQSDAGKSIPAIPASINSVGEAIEPNYYGSPAVKIPTYWGADCDVGVFVGMRPDVVVHCAIIGGFRKQSLLFSSGDSINLPRLKDWQGNSYPELTVNGTDGLNCNTVEMWGGRSGLSMQGAEPFMDLMDYGTNYKEYIKISFSSQPVQGDRVEVGRAAAKCGFQFVAMVNGVYPAVINKNDYPVRIRATLEATIHELVKAVQKARHDYTVKADTSLGIHAVWGSRFDATSMILVARFPDSTSFKDLVTAVVTSGGTRIIPANNGSPITDTNFKPYYWADTTTPASELALWGNKDGSFKDNRGSYGMSDATITDFSIKGIRRGGLVVGQISKNRDRYVDRALGACIIRDGLAGNSSAKMQKCFIQNGRIGFSGYGTALQFGLCNLTTLDHLIPDEGTSGPIWTSATEGSYGWYMESREGAVSTMRIRVGNAMPSPSPLRSESSTYSFNEAMGYGIKTKGISFDSDQSLTAYSRGTYKPTLLGTVVPGTHTYGAQNNGYYQIVGDFCTLTFRLSVSNVDQLMSGPIRMTLPVPVYNDTVAQSGVTFGNCAGLNLTQGSGLSGYAVNGTDEVSFQESNNTGTVTISQVTKFSTNIDIRGSITYKIT